MKIAAIHHVRFEVTDFDRTEAFAKDFGLTTVLRDEARLLMKTGGGDAFSYAATLAERPRFVGLALETASADDLDEAVAQHGATPRRRLDTPGGGEEVVLTDPNGFEVALVHGIATVEPAEGVPDLRHNSPALRVRHGDQQHQRGFGPPMLYRLGHTGLFVRSFAESAEWYGRVLGLVGSDIYHVPHDPEHKVVGFFRLDHGDEWVDHHTVALMQREQPDCHHISFEVQDYEAQFMAHRWLKSREHEAVWGVGRHPHGSHIFDVWRDPDGWRFETFSDTDLLNASRDTRIHNLKDVQMDMWSSDPPDRYFA
ncbi:VOC family protein [Sphingomonas sp.]|jgi:catechol 2,3-dioxygenase-like lactoylglutathione lyase family enzyme|uniref:VOC family protein n=1 Tax=Sphingomonas sp. TaxID=28214 RepID=UPI002D7FA5FD|nr:VOC family protein [Sphingomonas sp.]HEU0045410.1 VOC family protein [Sphingomonas sp.]